MSHRIRSISIVGGFLDGLRFDLADRLNCVIGARGSGKTTVVELLRWAIDAIPPQEVERRRIDTLVKRNLDGGRVQVDIETKEGLRYLISRVADEAPLVLTADGKPTQLALRSELFTADIFSQNEIEAIADRAGSQLDLIDNFDNEKIAEVESEIQAARTLLTSNASLILPLQEQLSALKEDVRLLPNVEEKLKAVASNGASSRAIDRAHKEKALRDRERRALNNTKAHLANYSRRIEQLEQEEARQARGLIDADLLSGPNEGLVAELATEIQKNTEDNGEALRRIAKRVARNQDRVAAIEERMNKQHAQQEIAFRELIEKHQAEKGQISERTRLEKLRSDLLAKRRQLADIESQLGGLHQERSALLDKLSNLQDRQFSIRQGIATTISERLAPAIRVQIVQYGNRLEYQKLLEEKLKGAGVKQSRVAEKITTAFGPADLVDIIRRKDADSLMKHGDLSQEQVEKVIPALVRPDIGFELETVKLYDLPKIELKDGGNYKCLSELSTGQKCTAILPILLLDSEHPLLVDQPEDNLDNRFIYERVVGSICKVKEQRQLIFVTHNP
ncbi:MAG: AAA family ATPase, partial [Gemmataceae bacterium]